MLLRDTSLTVLAAAARLGLPQPARFQVNESPESTLGDVATNYAMVATKEAGKPPMLIAELLAEELRKDPAYESVTVANPGFINITFTHAEIERRLAVLVDLPFDAPTRAVHTGMTVLLEAGSENVAKPMGVGHLRSNIIGMACARIWRATGANTIVVNHLGDWGTQFGKLVVAVKKWGDEAVIRERGIPELVALYQRFTQEAKVDPTLDDEGRAMFLKLEQNDPEVRRLWQWFVELSLRDYQAMYDRLGVVGDHVIGESFYEEKMQPIIDELVAKGIATKNDDGSIGIEFPKKELPSTILQKANGSTLYLTRDLAALRYRLDTFRPDRLFYFVGAEQELHFRQVFKTAQMLGWEFDATHAPHGLVLGIGGKKMSTREGTAVTIAELFARAEETSARVIAERGSDAEPAEQTRVARDLATAAIMYNDLSQNRTTAIVFDWEKMLAFEGDTAPYLLYAVARANSLEGKSEGKIVPGSIRIDDPKEARLARELLLLHDRIVLAAETLKPNMLAEQLYRIAQAFSGFYADLPILTAAPAVASSRYALAMLTRKMLRSGLDLLGIPKVEKM